MSHSRAAQLLVAVLLVGLVSGCGSGLAALRAPTATPVEPLTLTGQVQQTAPSAQLVVLAAPVEGITHVVLAPDGKVIAPSGVEMMLADLHPGDGIRASGTRSGGNALLAQRIEVLLPATAVPSPTPPPPTPTAPPTQTPTSTAVPREIRIDEPREGAAVTGTLRVRGWVSISPFENTLVVRILDADGLILLDEPILVDAEIGQPGTFDATLQFPVPASGSGALEVLEFSPLDGAVVASARIRITFAGYPETRITGTVQNVFASARVIALSEPDQGIRFIALTEKSILQDTQGREVTFDQVRPGTAVEAFGYPAGSDSLLATRVVLLGASATPLRREIRLDEPREGQTVTSPVRVRGWVSVSPFESTLLVRIRNAQGQLLAEAPILVNAPMGEPGNFDATVELPPSASGHGVIEVLELSPRDGSIVVSAAVNVNFAGAR